MGILLQRAYILDIDVMDVITTFAVEGHLRAVTVFRTLSYWAYMAMKQ